MDKTNHDVLIQLPVKSFASIVYEIVTRDIKTEQEFLELLNRKIQAEHENKICEVLQRMKHPAKS